jgi:transposase
VSRSKSARDDLVFVGLDVHKDSITSAVLEANREVPVTDRFFHDETSVRRFVAGFSEPSALRVCYEAGPTGYELQRLLARLGVVCEVIAPRLIPVAPGARVKTDSRDARRLLTSTVQVSSPRSTSPFPQKRRFGIWPVSGPTL